MGVRVGVGGNCSAVWSEDVAVEWLLMRRCWRSDHGDGEKWHGRQPPGEEVDAFMFAFDILML